MRTRPLTVAIVVAAVLSGASLVVDAAAGRPTDSGGSNTYPDLARLGPGTTDRG